MSTLLLAAVAAAAPVTLVHQGRIVDPTGAPVHGTFNVGIGLYADAVTPSALWYENAQLAVQDGYYTYTLGANTSLNPLPDTLFNGSPRYVGVALDTVVLGPRQLVTAAPYAVYATTAGSTTNVAPGGTVRLGTGTATCSGGALEGTLRYTTAGGFEACTATGWAAFATSTWNCATQPSHAGCVTSSSYASCSAIKTDTTFNGSDGLYYIDPDGLSGNAPFQVWCDMSTSTGGWTLAGVISSTDGIASNDCSSNWEGNDARWGDATVLADTAVNNTADHKYLSWSRSPFTEILIVESVAGGLAWKSWAVGSRTSLSSVFSSGCQTLANGASGTSGGTSHNNAVIHGTQLKANCNSDYANNDDSSKLFGENPGNADWTTGRYNGGWGLGVDGDVGNCNYGSEARPARGGWTNQVYPSAVYYTGGNVGWGGTDVGAFWARIYVR